MDWINHSAITGISALWTCLVIAVAASSISHTITQTELFAPLRKWMPKLGHMIGYLFTCFYCMSHWVVALGVLIYQPVLIHSGSMVADLVVSAFFTITLSAFISGLLFKVFLTAIAMKVKQKEAQAFLSQK